MAARKKARRSFWMYGPESDEPNDEQRMEHAKQLSEQLGVTIEPPRIPRVGDLQLRTPRLKPPDSIAEFCFSDNYERALNSHGGYRELAIHGEFPNPADVGVFRRGWRKTGNNSPAWYVSYD